MSANPHGKERYDIYGPIHKGLRRSMCSLLERIGSNTFTDAAQRTALLNEMRQLLSLTSSHLKHEETFMHPSIEERAKGASSKLASEHIEHNEEMDELRALAAQVESATDAARPAAVKKLYLAFSGFVAENLVHMGEEETDMQTRVLHAHFTDEEIMAMEGRILAGLPPELIMGFMNIMIPAMNRDERVGLLGMMKQGAPPEAFNAVLQVAARPNLSAADFQDLTQRLGVSA